MPKVNILASKSLGKARKSWSMPETWSTMKLLCNMFFLENARQKKTGTGSVGLDSQVQPVKNCTLYEYI